MFWGKSQLFFPLFKKSWVVFPKKQILLGLFKRCYDTFRLHIYLYLHISTYVPYPPKSDNLCCNILYSCECSSCIMKYSWMNATIWVYVDSLTFDVILNSLWERGGSLNKIVFGPKIAIWLKGVLKEFVQEHL